jgi:hypothetical protein
MNMKRQWRWWCAAGCGLALAALTGCQTWVAGMTLPSGHYLQHPPQYFGEGPAFPLTRELTRMEEQQANVQGPAPAVAAPPAPLPAPVPGAPPGP